VVPKVLLRMQAQPFEQVPKRISPHHDAVDRDICFTHLTKGFVEAGIQVPIIEQQVILLLESEFVLTIMPSHRNAACFPEILEVSLC